MRIVSWNCNGGYRRKHAAIMALQPDILVLQEASERDCAGTGLHPQFWTGRGHRGLVVFNVTGTELSLDPTFDPDLPWFLPVRIGNLRLLAVWASVLTPTMRYVRLIHRALDHYAAFMEDDTSGLVLGDLNSSTVFDRKHGSLNHSELVERLSRLGFTSLWHHQQLEQHGAESRPTFYMYRRQERTWHLDYAFGTADILARFSMQIGDPTDWLSISDHLPLIVDIDQKPHDLATSWEERPS